ncbi:hypothetical protein RJ895_09655 [Pseudomonas aeruginosa]|uniref:hypothetical protein n=1 Tax=Pseudomonas aeruginosa TaxID=287 RepID=UPI00301579FC
MKSLSRPDFENGRLLLVDCDERTLASLHKSLRRLGITSRIVGMSFCEPRRWNEGLCF